MSYASKIDKYFTAANYYPWVPYGDHGFDIVEQARANALDLEVACAVTEHESGGKNLFGCDAGAEHPYQVPFCQVAVNRERVRLLIQYIETTGKSNGVGLPALTFPPYIREAQRLGGAHIVRFQLQVGYRALAEIIRHYGLKKGLGVYNAGPAEPNMAYAAEVMAKVSRWKRVLY